MANRYNVASGDFSSTSIWSTTSGGAPGASAPTSSDVAIFDTHSTGSVNLSGNNTVLALDMTNGLCTLTGGYTIQVDQYAYLGAGNTYSGSTSLALGGVAGHNCSVNFNGAIWNGGIIVQCDTATLTVQSDLQCAGSFSHKYGTINTNDHNITCFNAGDNNNGASRTLNMGASTFFITGNLNPSWSYFYGTTINCGTSTIKFTNVSSSTVSMICGGNTYYKIWWARGTATGINVVGTDVLGSDSANRTFTTLVDDGTVAHQLQFNKNGTLFVTNFNVSGAGSSAKISLRSSLSGSRFTLSKPSGTVSCNYLDIKDSLATGGASWYAGTTSTDSGNNVGWNFSSGTQSLTPVLYSNTQTFFTQVVGRGPKALTQTSRYSNSQTFFTQQVRSKKTLTAAKYTNTQAFFTQIVSGSLLPARYNNSQTFFTQTVTRGAVHLTATLYSNSQTFYAQQVRSTTHLAIPTYSNTNTFFTQTITMGTATLSVSKFTNTQTFFTQVLSGGLPGDAITLDLYQNTNTFFSQAVGLAPYRLSNSTVYQNQQAFYSATVGTFLLATSYTNTQTFFTPTITRGAVHLQADLFVNTQEFFGGGVFTGLKSRSYGYIL